MLNKAISQRITTLILTFAVILLVFSPGLARADDVLFLDTPAGDWQKEAFPLGNGRLGGMVFGGVEEERIQFNVDSLWTGDENLKGSYGAPGMGYYQNFGDLYIISKRPAGTRRIRSGYELERW